MVNSLLSLNPHNQVYINSRGVFAYYIANKYISTFLKRKVNNNLDIRGVSEEKNKAGKKTLVYYLLDRISRKITQNADTITTVSESLKKYLVDKYLVDSKKINVIPTSSMAQYSINNSQYIKKDLVHVGKFAWISKNELAKELNKLFKLLNSLSWKLDIIGNSSDLKSIIGEEKNINTIPRVSPDQLIELLPSYYAGVIIRDQSIVNRVASPCKVSDYLCQGLPIVYSGNIGSINDFIKRFPESKDFFLSLDQLNDKQVMIAFSNINESYRKKISAKAQSYFGVQKVVTKYINYFTSNRFGNYNSEG